MQDFNDHILFRTHQHIIVLVKSISQKALFIALPLAVIFYFIVGRWTLLIFVLVAIICILYDYFFWKKGYFFITNDKIGIKIRNGFFSKFHISILFRNIKDIAYSKNNVLHYMFDYGTFFARSGGGTDGDFLAENLPGIEKIYKYVSFILSLTEEERNKLEYLEISSHSNSLNKEDIIDKEIKNLLEIKGIKEVILLNKEDKDFIFQSEEDRNHGVYETLKRDIVLCFTHDSDFREADNTIVIQQGNKVIFPAVSFHEVRQKNVVSSSPSLKVHQYLSQKFKSIDEMDATVLIGFDL